MCLSALLSRKLNYDVHVNAGDMDTAGSANCECIPKVRRLIPYSSSQHRLKPAANMPSPPDPSAGSTKHTHDRCLLCCSAGIQSISSATKGIFLL